MAANLAGIYLNKNRFSGLRFGFASYIRHPLKTQNKTP
jgi:hypothetical protein